MIFHAAGFAELDTSTLYALLKLRTDIFVVEQECAYPELDGRDAEPGTRHLWFEKNRVPVAYLRMLTDIEASPEGWREHGRFDQPFRSKQNSWSHPVVSGGKLYLRDMDVLLCYQVGK